MNLLSARRLHSYLLPTEHLNPHLGDPLMSHVPIQRRENKEEKGSCTPPLSFLQYLVLPPLPCPFAFPAAAGFIGWKYSSRPTERRPSQPGLDSISSWAHPGPCVPLIGNYGKEEKPTHLKQLCALLSATMVNICSGQKYPPGLSTRCLGAEMCMHVGVWVSPWGPRSGEGDSGSCKREPDAQEKLFFSPSDFSLVQPWALFASHSERKYVPLAAQKLKQLEGERWGPRCRVGQVKEKYESAL